MAIVKRWRRPGRPSVYRCDYLDAGGIRRRKTFETKEAAEEFSARTTLDGRQHLNPVIDPCITVRDYADRWLGTLRNKQSTVATYRKHLDLYLLPAMGKMLVRDLRGPRIKAVLARLLADFEARGRKGRAIVKLALAVVRKMLPARSPTNSSRRTTPPASRSNSASRPLRNGGLTSQKHRPRMIRMRRHGT